MARERPIVLYKYKDISGAGIDHVEDMLRARRIWFSCAPEFNDPFDCRCVFDVGNPREEFSNDSPLWLSLSPCFVGVGGV